MDDLTEKRRLVLNACAQTIATACRHLHQEAIDSAKESTDVVALVKAKAALKADYTAWTAPIFAEMERLDTPPLIVMPAA